MRKKSTNLTAGMLLAVLVCALAWYFLAPAKLGGNTSYVVTHGVSMEPQFHTGDLAILRTRSEYRVGEIVGYRSATLHTIVMHRIVADDGGAFTLKGDNNTWTDPDRPTRADLIGSFAVRVPHGGRYLAALDSTAGRCLAGGLLALLLLGGAGRARRRRALRTTGGRHRAAPAARSRPSRQPRNRPTATPATAGAPARRLARGQAVVAAATLLAMAGGEAWLLQTPATQRTTRTLAVEQTGTFGYSAAVPSSVVYPDGRVHSGAPIFTQIARSVDFSFDYRAAAPLTGSVALVATLVGPSGWTTPLAAGGSAPVRGGRGRATVSVDLARAQTALDAFTSATGVKSVSTSVVVTPTLAVAGTVDGQPVTGGFAGKLTLAAGASQLIPVTTADSSRAAAGQQANPLLVTSPLDVRAPTTTGHVLHVLSWRIGVLPARIAVGAGAAAALGWLIAILIGSRRTGRAEDDVLSALRHYGDRIVDAEPAPLDGPIVDLTSLAALHSVAERYDRVILHTTRGARHSYLVRDELSWYRYEVRPDRGQHATRRDAGRPPAGADVLILDAPVISLQPRTVGIDVLPGSMGPAAWADGYARAS